MELKEYINILKKRFLFILVVTLLSTFTMAVFSYLIIKPTYKTDISVIIGKGESTQNTNTNYNDIMMYQQLVKTYSDLVMSRKVINDTKTNLNLNIDIETLSSMISVSPQGSTEFLKLTVKSKNPEQAKNIANQLAKSLKSVSKEVFKQDNVQLVDEALLPAVPDSPRPLLNMAIAFFLGLMLSIGIVFLLEYLDNTIKTQEDIEKLIGVTVIGLIPLVNQQE